MPERATVDRASRRPYYSVHSARPPILLPMAPFTNPALARSQLLMDRGRYALAEEEVRRGLAQEPENALLMAQLALCVAEDPSRAREAMDTALRAAGQAPDNAAVWYAVSRVAERHGTVRQAENAAGMALSLAPEVPALLLEGARLLMEDQRYRAATGLVERALAIDPEDHAALMLAGAIRSRMGMHAHARAHFDRALELAPNDYAVQANAGWAALRRGDPEAAARHFRMALALAPEEERAQRGLVEAMRSRNAAYAFFSRMAVRLRHVPRFFKWACIYWALGGLAYLTLGRFPRLLLFPVQAAVVCCAILAWAAPQLADLLLLRDPETRGEMDPVRRACAVGVAALLALGAALGLAMRMGAGRPSGIAAVVAVFLSIPVATAPRLKRGLQRRIFAWLAVLLAVCGLMAVVRRAQGADDMLFWLMALALGSAALDCLGEDLPQRRRR